MEVVIKFRKKLRDRGHTLKWWHGKNLKKTCKYSYFVKQINDPDCMQDDVKLAIEKFLKERGVENV